MIVILLSFALAAMATTHQILKLFILRSTHLGQSQWGQRLAQFDVGLPVQRLDRGTVELTRLTQVAVLLASSNEL